MNIRKAVRNFTQLTDSGVKQTTDVLGEITERFANVREAAFDKAIQQKLIEMGWTPPGGANFDRAAAVKAGAAALKREAAWVAVDLSDADAERCTAAVFDAILTGQVAWKSGNKFQQNQSHQRREQQQHQEQI